MPCCESLSLSLFFLFIYSFSPFCREKRSGRFSDAEVRLPYCTTLYRCRTFDDEALSFFFFSLLSGRPRVLSSRSSLWLQQRAMFVQKLVHPLLCVHHRAEHANSPLYRALIWLRTGRPFQLGAFLFSFFNNFKQNAFIIQKKPYIMLFKTI